MSVVACPVCNGAGVRHGRRGLRTCLRCDGASKVVVQDEPVDVDRIDRITLIWLVVLGSVMLGVIVVALVTRSGA